MYCTVRLKKNEFDFFLNFRDPAEIRCLMRSTWSEWVMGYGLYLLTELGKELFGGTGQGTRYRSRASVHMMFT